VTPHLTYTSPTGVRANDNPTTATINTFGPSLPTGTIPNGTTVGVSNFITIAGAGRVYMNPDGTFVFYPDAGVSTGTFSFFYTIAGGDTAEVELTFDGQELVWFVSQSTPTLCIIPNNIGTQACPDSDTTIIETQDTPNDTIFFAQAGADYFCEPLTLETGERVVGDGSTSTLSAISGVTPVAGSGFPTFTGTNPILNNAPGDCITLSSNNLIDGITIRDTTGYAIASAVNIGTTTVVRTNITGSGGLFSLTGGGTFNATFGTLTSTGHTSNVILLFNMSGTITNTAGSISHNVSNATVDINGSNPSFTYTGNITKTAGGYVVAILNTTGNTVSFTGTISQDVATGQGIIANTVAGTASFNTLNLGSLATRLINTAITISNSNGTVNLGTVSAFTNGVTAMNATNNNGTINSTTGTINATNGRAITIDGPVGLTTLGMTLTSVSSGNTATGMVIQDTDGTFTVTGDGGGASNGSGGTIQNTTADAVQLNNTNGLISLNYMIIQDIGDMGGGMNTLTGHNAIDGVNVNGGLSLNRTIIRRISDQAIFGGTFGSPDTPTVWNGLAITNSTIENTNRYHVAGIGDANSEGMIRILGIRGTVTITDSTLQDGAEMLDFFVNGGTLN
ncbi:MAG: hypothetical protein KJ043_16855, partial [Anaerolineae bacterium]|nr:hypothetical protein [Anaerolineae bacterium]